MATSNNNNNNNTNHNNNNNQAVSNYKECRKNHALAVGGHAVDGCREFTPSGPAGTDQALHCQACSCHRSFHRTEVVVFRNGRAYVQPSPPLPVSMVPLMIVRRNPHPENADGEIEYEPITPVVVPQEQADNVNKRIG